MACSHCVSLQENKTEVRFTVVSIFSGNDKLTTLFFNVIKKSARKLTESMTVAQYFACSHSRLAEKTRKTKTRE